MANRRKFHSADELLQLLQKGALRPDELTPHQRRVIVKYYVEYIPEASNISISKMIGCSDMHICRLKNEMLQKGAWEIDAIDVKKVALTLKKHKEEFQRRALMNGDISLAWKIECEYVSKMQDLGFVYQAPQKITLTAESTFELALDNFFNTFGVPDVNEFVKRLSESGGVAGLLGESRSRPEGADAGDREHPENGSSRRQ